MKTLPLLLSPLLLLASCGKKSQTTEVLVIPVEPSAELVAIFSDTAAAAPQAIHLARKDAKPGDTLVLKGRVMGSVSPFVEGRAAFTIGDEEILTACSDMPGDNCETPWDNCCDSKDAFREGVATVQVIDGDGRVFKEEIEGVAGLEKLSRVVLEGVVAEGSSPESLVINATAIHVMK